MFKNNKVKRMRNNSRDLLIFLILIVIIAWCLKNNSNPRDKSDSNKNLMMSKINKVSNIERDTVIRIKRIFKGVDTKIINVYFLDNFDEYLKLYIDDSLIYRGYFKSNPSTDFTGIALEIEVDKDISSELVIYSDSDVKLYQVNLKYCKNYLYIRKYIKEYWYDQQYDSALIFE